MRDELHQGRDESRLPPGTRVGSAHLRVASIDRSLEFYAGLLGMHAFRSNEDGALLGAGHAGFLRLSASSGAKRQPPHVTGLYHVALLLPSRADLARALTRLHDERWPLHGFADHAVSEAIYLSDPDGNGLEIYADRERESWPWDGEEIGITTDPLDVDDLLRAVDQDPGEWKGMPAGSCVGHVHLRVSSLATAERFYARVLGMDVTARGYPGALFLSAGGYHHHIGLNVWAGVGAPRAPGGTVGIIDFEIVVPDPQARARLRERALAAGFAVGDAGDSWRLTDPDGVAVLISGADDATAGG